MRLIDADALKRRAQKSATESWKMNIKAKVETVLNQFIDWIDEAPSIKTEPQWIPCSERMPEEDLWKGIGGQYSNSVLMTVFDKNDKEIMVDFGYTMDGEWYSETADEFIESIADWNVIAWMPLPEPWKGVKE